MLCHSNATSSLYCPPRCGRKKGSDEINLSDINEEEQEKIQKKSQKHSSFGHSVHPVSEKPPLNIPMDEFGHSKDDNILTSRGVEPMFNNTQQSQRQSEGNDSDSGRGSTFSSHSHPGFPKKDYQHAKNRGVTLVRPAAEGEEAQGAGPGPEPWEGEQGEGDNEGDTEGKKHRKHGKKKKKKHRKGSSNDEHVI